MTEEQFRETMCIHMRKQTEFLEGIFEAMKAIRTIGKFLAWIGTGVSAVFGLWEIFKALKGS